MQKYYFYLLAIIALSCQSGTQQPAAPAAPGPNIVFIFTDDLGYGDLGCFGATDIATPHIDQMAASGIRFTEFYSASPVCSPSRAGLLTGRMPQRMGINSVFFPESFTGMAPEEITLAEKLKEAGYHTGIVGKWHLGHMRQFLPLQQGFDEYYGIPYSNDMESVVYMKDNDVDSFRVNQRYTTQVYTKKAVDFIDRHKGSPFFLYVAHNMPHVPIYASPKFEGTSQRGLYGDVIQEIDWSVGQILDKLEAEGLLENTLVVFSSDNGPWLVMEDHGGSAGPLREGKQYTFEGGVRVPTLAMWQGTIPAGQVYENMATQMDWFPTFLQLNGLALPDDRPIDGKDLSQVLMGTGERAGDTFIYYYLANLRCYRKGDFKAKVPFPGFKGSPVMKAVAAHDTLLFNLKEDPGEQNNLFDSQPGLARELLREMEAQVEALGPLPPSLVIRSPADRSHLKYLDAKHGRK